MRIERLGRQRVAVWGCGREGLSMLRLLSKRFPGKTVLVLDDKIPPPDVQRQLAALQQEGRLRLQFAFGERAAESLAEIETVVKSPGISIYRPEIVAAQERGVAFTSATQLWFAEHTRETVVGVTGTKGKSTTTALVTHLLQGLGIKALAAGNIGLPLSDAFASRGHVDVWVLELSSYQIADLGYAPDVGVLVSLYPCHLEWHKTLERYYKDKLKLFGNMKDKEISILDQEDANLESYRNQWRNPRFYNSESGIHCSREHVFDGETPLFSTGDYALLGRHNLSNLCAALTVVKALGGEVRACAPFLKQFRGLPHRLEQLGEREGVLFVNDSIATVPEATRAALAAFPNRSVILLAGGQDLGQDWSDLAACIAMSNVVELIVLPDSGIRLHEAVAAALALRPRPMRLRRAATVAEGVALALKGAEPGSVLLLSPGCPSYNQFRNFEERGNCFAESAGFPRGMVT
jgi:UDP-N-acetylmuramoyl-L-alanine---L-glutamate ligase